jgi:hypothetical protein
MKKKVEYSNFFVVDFVIWMLFAIYRSNKGERKKKRIKKKISRGVFFRSSSNYSHQHQLQ